ncbi:hypothetical protein [Paeniglutamicibacter terrestris]|uniref:Uncharacterized protein n=1 Tax=Paeniglutamicibacter terrestris TaxID=2723403 RepID=A0ABX1G515_9MICC|nr:hypothetical protein [Paeniglutamicibacter terrestris]NKG21054.1 hypothetical protein [Paeniglutamicibacter terrestris]
MTDNPRLSLLSAVVTFEADGTTFPELHARVEAEVGPTDPYLLGQLWALTVQLSECADESDSWVAFLNSEIDTTLGDMLTKDNHYV